MQELLLEQETPRLLIPAMEHMNAADTANPMGIMFRQMLVDNPIQSTEFVQQFIKVFSQSLPSACLHRYPVCGLCPGHRSVPEDGTI